MNFFTRNIKFLLNTLGYDLHKINSSSKISTNLFKGLNNKKINLILDVGANVGQFSNWVRNDVGYSGDIISFEPIKEAHDKLTRFSLNDQKWTVYKRCAVGNIDSEVSINVSRNLVSSSILPITEIHTTVEKGSSYVRTEKTPLFKLDTICKNIDIKQNNTLLKIDTQGFESQVLEGAKDSLSFVDGIIIELSSITLYENQFLWLSIINIIEKKGFTLWSITNGFTDNNTGQALQLDAVFFRQ